MRIAAALLASVLLASQARAQSISTPPLAVTPGGTNGQVQFNNNGAFGGSTNTGTGSVVLQTAPSITNPTLSAVTFSGSAPTPTGTGTPTMVAGSTDNAGEAVTGASATSLIITFAVSKTNAPFCTVTPQTQLLAFAYTISNTAITITQTATTGEKIDYVCVQH